MEQEEKKQTTAIDLNVSDKRVLVDYPQMRDSFVNILVKIHHMSFENANSVFEREAMYFKKAVFENEYLKAATGLSLYSAFLEIAINNVSIQPGAKSEAFFESRSANQPMNGQANWVKVARLVITAYGELNMRINAGQIIRINNPIVIYECDYFQPKTNERGELMVDFRPAIPRTSKKIIGVYCCIVLPKGGLDFKWLLDDDIKRLEKYSIPKSGQNAKANALYSANDGQIDTGFLEAKCIKHAMRAYTRLKVSDSIAFEGDEPEEDQNFAQTAPVDTVKIEQNEKEKEDEVF